MKSPTRFFSVVSAVALAAGLTACGTTDPYGANNYPAAQTPVVTNAPYGTYPTQQAGFVEFGRITNVSLIHAGTAPSTGNTTAGTVIGAVVGGALGNQIGSGSGRAAATILGAVGGAVVGNRIAQNSAGTYNTAGPVHRVSVQTDQGQFRTYDVHASSDLRVGDRVRIENGVIYLS